MKREIDIDACGMRGTAAHFHQCSNSFRSFDGRECIKTHAKILRGNREKNPPKWKQKGNIDWPSNRIKPIRPNILSLEKRANQANFRFDSDERYYFAQFAIYHTRNKKRRFCVKTRRIQKRRGEEGAQLAEMCWIKTRSMSRPRADFLLLTACWHDVVHW